VKSLKVDDGEGVEWERSVSKSLDSIENKGMRVPWRAQEFGRCRGRSI
jgi:hypothetical protein